MAGPYVVFDAASGEVIAENDAFHPWYPASLTKLMTAYVTFHALRSREITPDTPVVMTANAAKEPPSKMGFKPGSAVSVDAALKILMVKSANDVAVALAETVGGSEDAFIARMNAAAARLGMVGTRFANPHGLPHKGQWTTARDFGLLARAIIREFPQYRDLFRITALQLGGQTIKTHNHLLERYPGTDGMKTGFICSSGFNVVTSTTRGGRRLVAVVMGELNAMARAEKTASLLETAFTTRAGLFSRRTTLENLRPSSAPPRTPTDMREAICGKNRNTGEDANAEVAATEQRSFLVPRYQVMAPVVITMSTAPASQAAPAAAGPAMQLPRPNPLRLVESGAIEATELLPEPTLDGVPPPEAPPIEILGIKGTGS
jgi:D-alanyl-D-alanine carboxypeptidase